VRGEGGRVFVVGGGGGISGPVLEEHVSPPGAKSLVGLSHEVRQEDVRPRGGGGACRTSGR